MHIAESHPPKHLPTSITFNVFEDDHRAFVATQGFEDHIHHSVITPEFEQFMNTYRPAEEPVVASQKPKLKAPSFLLKTCDLLAPVIDVRRDKPMPPVERASS